MSLHFVVRGALRGPYLHCAAPKPFAEAAILRSITQPRGICARFHSSEATQTGSSYGGDRSPEETRSLWKPSFSDVTSSTQQQQQQQQANSSPSRIPQPDTDIPWYLKVSPSSSSSALDTVHPMAERQKLPDLPAYPPPILSPLLNHLFMDLGLDDLQLIDLRALDRTPALGSDLIMVIGSARSEKHLHSSADRCCRWLRTEHRLTPYADGLLGRNELKLKLRRKARRARLMATVGASTTASDALDDGIRTGWVCVNVGRVNPAEGAPVQTLRQEDFVGFGELEPGVNIVVQMFTEEKRAEVGLDTLWRGVLKRSIERKGLLEEGVRT